MTSALDSCFSYLLDEKTLVGRIGAGVRVPPLRLFTLRQLGIDQDMFIGELLPTFSTLHLDPYDAKRNKIAFLKRRLPSAGQTLDGFLPRYYAGETDLDEIHDLIRTLKDADRHEFDRIGLTGRRKRSVASFDCFRTGGGKARVRPQNDWFLRRIPAQGFAQNVASTDPRSFTRVFHEASERLMENPSLLPRLMENLAAMVGELHPEAHALKMTMHQMFIFADMMTEGDNAPEGIHQDGADYIVSALVVERAGILGGESIVYAPDKKTEFLRHTLMPGEGIFQDDRTLWHDVTPFKEDPRTPPAYGSRSIFGFDITLARALIFSL